MKSRYITLDDLKEYSGIDLVQDLRSTEKAEAFLARIEIRMNAFLNARMHQNIDMRYPTFTDNQKLHYKFALLEQAMYVYKNGEISVDNGYDPESGMKVDEGNLLKITISRNAQEHLMIAGVWTYKLRPYGVFTDNQGWWLW